MTTRHTPTPTSRQEPATVLNSRRNTRSAACPCCPNPARRSSTSRARERRTWQREARSDLATA